MVIVLDNLQMEALMVDSCLSSEVQILSMMLKMGLAHNTLPDMERKKSADRLTYLVLFPFQFRSRLKSQPNSTSKTLVHIVCHFDWKIVIGNLFL